VEAPVLDGWCLPRSTPSVHFASKNDVSKKRPRWASWPGISEFAMKRGPTSTPVPFRGARSMRFRREKPAGQRDPGPYK